MSFSPNTLLSALLLLARYTLLLGECTGVGPGLRGYELLFIIHLLCPGPATGNAVSYKL